MKDMLKGKFVIAKGIEIIREREKQRLYMSLRKYIKKVLERFHMSDAYLVSTHLAL